MYIYYSFILFQPCVLNIDTTSRINEILSAAIKDFSAGEKVQDEGESKN